MTDDDNVIATVSDGFVTADIAETPDFSGGYETAMSGALLKVVRIWFHPTADPDEEFDPDTDPWNDREESGFDLPAGEAVKLAMRLLELAGE